VSLRFRPSVAVGTTRRAVTAHAGAVLLRDVMDVVGLVPVADSCLTVKRRARGLSDGQFVAAIAESVALGARCLDDLAVTRADTAQETMRGFAVPAPQTAGTWLRRFTLGHKRIAIPAGEHPTLDGGDYHHWVLVTNDHQTDAAGLEAEYRHKAQVEAGMRELKSNFGLHALRKHGFMANWAWLLLVCLGHNLCCWVQQLGPWPPVGTDPTCAPSVSATAT
jgi:DDE family transposase